jgi:uncharacterized protein (DUF885 family)
MSLRARGPRELHEDVAFARDLLTRLDSISTDDLSNAARLTAAFLRSSLTAITASVDDIWYSFPVTPYNSIALIWYVQHVFAPFTVATVDDAERFVRLLSDFARIIQVDREILREQAARGIRVPRPALPGVRATLEGVTAGASAVIPAPQRFEGLGTEADAWTSRVRRSLDEDILPAFDALLKTVEAESGAAPEAVGLYQYPGGDEAYRRAVKRHTNLPLDPNEVHQVGLAEVTDLTERMAQVRERLGAPADEATFHAALREDLSLYARTPEEVEQRYWKHIHRFEPHIGRFFSVLPKAPYGVKRLDPAAEPGMTYGYYEMPTPEEPVGHYRYNGSNLDKRPMISAAALMYHELIPGHHFHLARQTENDKLPPLRRQALEFGSFNEGWAEYAASLPEEVGTYEEDPLDRYGRLVHERFTAQRLVVDTGMNALGWPLERAREYMRAMTMESDTQIGTETLRYSTDMPAQALAYRMGFLTFRRLRREAEETLGTKLDIRELHETILGAGALPLDVLQVHVREYIQRSK